MELIFTELHEALFLHYIMLTRQLAKLSDSLLHIVRLHNRAKDAQQKKALFEGYRRYAQTELADSNLQIKQLCRHLDLSFEETVKMGDERDKEKKAEFQKKYPNESWI